MNLVYHGRYVDYWEWARTELLRSHYLPYHEIESKGFLIPCIDINLKYHSPAHYDEYLETELSFSIIDRIKLFFEYSTKSDDSILVSGNSTHIFTDLNRKPVRIPKFFKEIYDEKA